MGVAKEAFWGGSGLWVLVVARHGTGRAG